MAMGSLKSMPKKLMQEMPGDALRALGDRHPVAHDCEEDIGERDRDERQEVRCQTQARDRDQKPDQRRADAGGKERDGERDVVGRHQDRRKYAPTPQKAAWPRFSIPVKPPMTMLPMESANR